jgi:hypothetical protein
MNRFELLEERTSGIKYIIELISEKIKMIVVYFSDDNWNMMYIHYENAASSHGKNHKLLNLYTKCRVLRIIKTYCTTKTRSVSINSDRHYSLTSFLQ